MGFLDRINQKQKEDISNASVQAKPDSTSRGIDYARRSLNELRASNGQTPTASTLSGKPIVTDNGVSYEASQAQADRINESARARAEQINAQNAEKEASIQNKADILNKIAKAPLTGATNVFNNVANADAGIRNALINLLSYGTNTNTVQPNQITEEELAETLKYLINPNSYLDIIKTLLGENEENVLNNIENEDGKFMVKKNYIKKRIGE